MDWTKMRAYLMASTAIRQTQTPLDKRMELERSRAKTQADDTKL